MDFGSHLGSPGGDLEFHFGQDSLIFGICFSAMIFISIVDRFLVDFGVEFEAFFLIYFDSDYKS